MRSGFLTLALLFCCCLSAQSYKSRIHYKVELGNEEQLHQLILLDYTKLLGTALEVDERTIRFRARSATEISYIPTNKLRFLGVFKPVGAANDGAGAGAGATIGFTDLTYEPTALPYSTKAEVKVINLLYATTEWSLNDHFQIGVGLAGPLGIVATQRARWSLSPLLHVGVSNKMLYVPLAQSFEERLALLGDAHAMVTIGTSHRFLNLGSGVLYDNVAGGRGDGRGVAWGHRMGFGARLSPRWTLYSEALMILTKGNSFRGRRNLTLLPTFNAALHVRQHRWNFGLVTFQEEGNSFFPPPIPYVSYSYYWGGR